MLYYVEIFYREQEPNYGRIHKKSINEKLFYLLKQIEYKLCGLQPEIFNDDSVLNYNGAELDLVYYLLYKYDILRKVIWVTSSYEKNKMYIMTNIINDNIFELKQSGKYNLIQDFVNSNLDN